MKKINFPTYQDVQIFVFIRLFKETCCIIVGKICLKLEGFFSKIEGYISIILSPYLLNMNTKTFRLLHSNPSSMQDVCLMNLV